ncbi:MAG: DUF302 domain-containing protein [Clostridia bacterium]
MSSIVVYARQAKFEDVSEDLKLAIEGKGLVVDHVSYIGRMLERTGRDVGSGRRLFADAQAFQFCSAVLSRATMEADASNIAFCPYTITVYETIDEPGKVRVSYRRPAREGGSAASRAALAKVERLLDAIAREAAGVR